jgi:hypothetical protein
MIMAITPVKSVTPPVATGGRTVAPLVAEYAVDIAPFKNAGWQDVSVEDVKGSASLLRRAAKQLKLTIYVKQGVGLVQFRLTDKVTRVRAPKAEAVTVLADADAPVVQDEIVVEIPVVRKGRK